MAIMTGRYISQGRSADLRRYLVKRGMIEAVVRMSALRSPRELNKSVGRNFGRGDSGESFYLVVLSEGNDAISLVDGGSFGSRAISFGGQLGSMRSLSAEEADWLCGLIAEPDGQRAMVLRVDDLDDVASLDPSVYLHRERLRDASLEMVPLDGLLLTSFRGPVLPKRRIAASFLSRTWAPTVPSRARWRLRPMRRAWGKDLI